MPQVPLGYSILARALPTWSVQIWWLRPCHSRPTVGEINDPFSWQQDTYPAACSVDYCKQWKLDGGLGTRLLVPLVELPSPLLHFFLFHLQGRKVTALFQSRMQILWTWYQENLDHRRYSCINYKYVHMYMWQSWVEIKHYSVA